MDEFERVKFVERTAALMVAVGIGELDGDGKRIFPPAGFLWKFLRAHSMTPTRNLMRPSNV